MSEDVDENKYPKQRRNFIATCLILIIYHVGDISLSKINILGTEIDVKNPVMVTALLHIFFAYFAWRFWNAFSDIEAWNKHILLPIRLFISNKAKKIVLNKLSFDEDDFEYQLESPQLETALWFKYIFSYNVLSINNKGDYVRTEHQPRLETVTKWHLIQIRIECIIKEIFGKSIFSEYIFPFIMGIVAVLTIFDTTLVKDILSLFIW